MDDNTALEAVILLIRQSGYGTSDRRALIDWVHHNYNWCEMGWTDPRTATPE